MKKTQVKNLDWKDINGTRNYLFEEINWNELWVKSFASLIGIPIGITSFVIGLRICAITVGIKKYKSIIEKEKKETL